MMLSEKHQSRNGKDKDWVCGLCISPSSWVEICFPNMVALEGWSLWLW